LDRSISGLVSETTVGETDGVITMLFLVFLGRGEK